MAVHAKDPCWFCFVSNPSFVPKSGSEKCNVEVIEIFKVVPLPSRRYGISDVEKPPGETQNFYSHIRRCYEPVRLMRLHFRGLPIMGQWVF